MDFFFFFSSRRRHTRCSRDWSSDVCSSDLQEPLDGLDPGGEGLRPRGARRRGRDRARTGERRGGEEGRTWGAAYHLKKKKNNPQMKKSISKNSQKRSCATPTR